MNKFRNLVLGAALAAATILPSLADTLQFAPDSTVVTRERFSDEIVGHGPDIIFIPGLASSRETWKATAMRLKDHYRVHLIQLAGFAGEPSRANATGPVLVPTAEAIDAYLVEQHLTPATVIGHSLGGTMALYLAEKHGADLKKVMLVDALPFYSVLMAGPTATSDSIRPMAERMRASGGKMTDEQRAKMLAGMATSQASKDMIAGWSKASDGNVVANAAADDMELDLRPGLAAIKTPVTMLFPDYAPVGSPAGATAIMYSGAFAPLPGVKLVPITNSVHFIMLDQPAQFSAALDAFLAN
ncbi:MAG TPA: alpha/beta hydrolase [Rhizomicrobium sp.]|jgi:pimeloyl-ACP methyl ester carboxylesterase